MTSNPVPHPLYPTSGRCRHGRNPCPDFWCGMDGREADRQIPETRGEQDATPTVGAT